MNRKLEEPRLVPWSWPAWDELTDEMLLELVNREREIRRRLNELHTTHGGQLMHAQDKREYVHGQIKVLEEMKIPEEQWAHLRKEYEELEQAAAYLYQLEFDLRIEQRVVTYILSRNMGRIREIERMEYEAQLMADLITDV
jgi:hypothetical protein